MKKVIQFCLVLSFLLISVPGCDKKYDFEDTPCGDYNGNPLYKEPGGGCYYIVTGGTRMYVEKSECDCN